MDDKWMPTDGENDVTRVAAAPRSRVSGLWVGVILSAVVLVFLLVFILQNGNPVLITFLGWTQTLPTGVALLFAAIAGVLLVAIPGSIRILQLRRAAATEGFVTERPSHRG
ncbi:LapA family protein [Pseudonocardia adelaidensis]|uniref:Lipopolysaccharide assembly protein A domain-containing protein n=1 Tax=Pseudonocardia adelaidensis TaxID=648754 RepID=A0ABP9NLN5_9PSEU